MTSAARLQIFAAFALLMTALAGSAGRPVAGPTNATDLLKRVAQSIHIGRAFDSGVLALRDGNEAAIASTSAELSRISASMPASRSAALKQAEALVQQAQSLDVMAQSKPGVSTQNPTQQATLLYRQALQLAPRFEAESKDANLLNALGYFLADRGSSSDDFRRAEALTRRSLQIMAAEDWSAEQSWQRWLGSNLADVQKQLQLANVRDSLAWALFRQNRLAVAAVEQERVLAQTESAFGALQKRGVTNNPIAADLPFHLGEIYRAQGRLAEARRQYEAALRLEADHVASREALRLLNTSPQRNAAPRSSP